MKVLAILSQKGGVGKTTLATCLAVAAEQAGKEVCDHRPRPAGDRFLLEGRAPARHTRRRLDQPVRLTAMLKACADAGTDLVVIDGAAVARDVTFEAARHADFILIPTKTAVFDTMSMTHTLEVVRQLDRAFAVVLTFVPPQGQETGDAMKAVEELGAAVCPVTVGNRKAFFRAQAVGQAVQEFEPHGPAAAEIKQLYEYTSIRLYDQVEVA